MLTNTMAVALAGSALLSSVQAAPSSQFSRQAPLKFNFGNEKVRGVNLGGWFVLEPWITPSIFQPYAASGSSGVVDEFTLTQAQGKDAAEATLQKHWSTWIVEDDFKRIAAAGFNFVRIPIGYWSITPEDGDPYVQGAYDDLSRSLGWAQNHGVHVLIDLHAGLGSQNGFDNSGRKGQVGWSKGNTVDRTLDALRKIRDDHADHPAVAAIEFLNEPMSSSMDPAVLDQFYYDAFGNLQNRGVGMTFHDAFRGVDAWNDFGKGLPDLVEDTHHYELFDASQLALSPSAHVSSACGFGNQMTYPPRPVIAGEWTGAVTDCALYLNGFGIGARWDGTYNVNGQGSSAMGSCDQYRQGSVSKWSQADKDNTARFIEAQLDAYEKAAGWVFWTWKTEGAPGWDMQDLIANGLFPQPIDSRRFPGQCN